jgi:histidine ammonia-lyase
MEGAYDLHLLQHASFVLMAKEGLAFRQTNAAMLFALAISTSDAKRLESLRFASKKSAQKVHMFMTQ